MSSIERSGFTVPWWLLSADVAADNIRGVDMEGYTCGSITVFSGSVTTLTFLGTSGNKGGTSSGSLGQDNPSNAKTLYDEFGSAVTMTIPGAGVYDLPAAIKGLKFLWIQGNVADAAAVLYLKA